MLTIGSLFLYTGMLGWLGDRALSRADWPSAAPRVALALWHALAAGVLLALSWALVLLAHDVMEHGFASALSADKTRVHLAYAPRAEVSSYWNVTLVALLLGYLACLVAGVRRARSDRAITASHDVAVTSHLTMATAHGAQTVAVCSSSVPLIYCLPRGNRNDRIRVTTGALELLQGDELLAAVDHEDAHIRSRHHLQLLIADSVVAGLRWTRLLRNYPTAVRELVEFQADDRAVAHHGVRTVATALLTMSSHRSVEAPGASWTGGTPAVRLHRLLRSRVTVTGSRLPRALGAAAIMCLPLLPSVAALAPAVAVATSAPSSHTADFVHHS